MNQLILASSSPYRKALLARLGITFDCQSPNLDETPQLAESAIDLVKRLAIAKAIEIAKTNQNAWILASDQVAHLQGNILGKPGSLAKAELQLGKCSGQMVEFVTGVALVNLAVNRSYYRVSKVRVKFRTLTQVEIERYLHRDQPFDCAGSFKIESLGVSLFDWVKSKDPTSLEGLPLISVCSLLRQAGFSLP